MQGGHTHSGQHHGGGGHWGRLAITLVLVLVYMMAEVVGGYLSGSLALLADAGHMLSDASSLLLALFALRIAQRPATRTHTFGYQRAEILAALANGAALVAVSGYIFHEAYQRMAEPPEVHGALMLGVAAGGLVVNLVGLWLLHGGRDASLNVRGAWLHVLADALGSVGAIVAGVLVMTLDWRLADPIASAVIGALVLYSSWSLLAQTVGVLMQAVPAHVDLKALQDALLSVEGVSALHDLHVWSVASGLDVMSAHLTLEADVDRRRVVDEVHTLLEGRFDLHHSTIQLDCPDECVPCEGVPQAS